MGVNNIQEVLQLQAGTKYNPNDYYISDSNKKAYEAVCSDIIGLMPYENILLIRGAKSTGKTFLAHIAARFHAGKIVNSLNDNQASTLIIDGADSFDEKDLLHIFNACNENNKKLIIFSNDNWQIKLKDLQSRINSIKSEMLYEPDDELMGVIISSAFSLKSLDAGVDVINYLKPRLRRNFDDILNFINEFDKFCLRQKRNVSVKSAAEFLSSGSL